VVAAGVVAATHRSDGIDVLPTNLPPAPRTEVTKALLNMLLAPIAA
jgi:hypothetical protein